MSIFVRNAGIASGCWSSRCQPANRLLSVRNAKVAEPPSNLASLPYRPLRAVCLRAKTAVPARVAARCREVARLSKTAKSKATTGGKDPYLVGLFAWLVPGAGHFYLGQKNRAAVFFVAIHLTFWMGMIIGGLQSTIDPVANKAWFFAQICAGLNTVASLILSKIPAAVPCYGKTLDLAIIYTAVAGLLNILVIFDAMVRANFPAGGQTDQATDDTKN